MTQEEKRLKQREYSRRYYMKNASKINAGAGKKCPCGSPAIGKLDGVPVCASCKKIEEGMSYFMRNFV